MRILMYSPDSIGLGHMRRNATIAAEVVRQRPSASVALMIGSGAGAFFSLPKGIDTIKLPSVQKVAAETWIARTLNLSARETCTMRAGIIRDVVHNLKPDLLLVDHLPMGVGGDLVPALELIRKRGLPTRTVLGLRDILDEPEVIRQRWSKQALYGFVADHFDRVLIYGDKSVFPTAELYGLEDCIPSGVAYAGYVRGASDAGRNTRGTRPEVTSLDGLAAWYPGEKVIVATGGGGNDAYPMLSAVTWALRRLDKTTGFRAVVIAGPLMPDADRALLEAEASGLTRTRLLPWTSDCMDYLAAADVSVVMAGYNSSLEALSTGSRVIMIPRDGPSAEQRMRAAMLDRQGLVTCIPQPAATPDRIEAALMEAMAAPSKTLSTQLLDGAVEAARVLLALAGAPSNRSATAVTETGSEPLCRLLINTPPEP